MNLHSLSVRNTHISEEIQPFLKIGAVLDDSSLKFLEQAWIPFLTSSLQPQSIPDNFSFKTIQKSKKMGFPLGPQAILPRTVSRHFAF